MRGYESEGDYRDHYRDACRSPAKEGPSRRHKNVGFDQNCFFAWKVSIGSRLQTTIWGPIFDWFNSKRSAPRVYHDLVKDAISGLRLTSLCGGLIEVYWWWCWVIWEDRRRWLQNQSDPTSRNARRSSIWHNVPHSKWFCYWDDCGCGWRAVAKLPVSWGQRLFI